jgi:hypothetical protein
MGVRDTAVVAVIAVCAALDAGCASHSERTVGVRSALDAGNMRGAIKVLNEEMDVKDDQELPKDLSNSDDALMVLDRASIQQALVQFKLAERDYQAADKAIDLLDLSSNAVDELSRYMFSESSSRYRAPPYEKLLINALNMIDYLETGDLQGAKVEARRLGVYMKYYRDKLKEGSPVLGLAGMLAGFAFEKSGDYNEALRFYDDALEFGQFPTLAQSVRGVAGGGYTTPRIKKVLAEGTALPPLEETGEGEVLVVSGYGRVPHKVANRVPIGLALTLGALYLSPGTSEMAGRLAAQGLVTWVNFPSLAPGGDVYESPQLSVDGRVAHVDQAVDVTSQVRSEWKKIEGKIIAAAITRMVTRAAVGTGIQAATSGGGNEGKVLGVLASMLVQGTMTALDKPDTRGWETLPARVGVSRVRVQPGHHVVEISARGATRRQELDVPKGGWATVSLMALR